MKGKIRFHWFYNRKPRICDGCEAQIEKNEGRYADYKTKKYYCRDCAELIGIGFDWCAEKNGIENP